MLRDLVCICFDFVCLHIRCSCCPKTCLLFQVVQTKQVDYKMNTKNVTTWATAQTRVQSSEKVDKLQLNKNKPKESQTRLMS